MHNIILFDRQKNKKNGQSMTACSLLYQLLLKKKNTFKNDGHGAVTKQHFCKTLKRKLRLWGVSKIGKYQIEIGRVRRGLKF